MERSTVTLPVLRRATIDPFVARAAGIPAGTIVDVLKEAPDSGGLLSNAIVWATVGEFLALVPARYLIAVEE